MNFEEPKCAIVTGGASGIGAATVEMLLNRKWRVAIVDSNMDAVTERAKANSDSVLMIQVDVRQPGAARGACDRVVEHWGRLDVLVNSAGVNRKTPLESLSIEDWNFVLEVNLTGTFLFMQAAALQMLKSESGSIVNLSSIAGARGVPDRCAYAATKAAVDSLTQSGAIAWASNGIRVNAVAPGFTKTPMVQDFIDKGIVNPDYLLSRTPMNRLATPEEIASAIVFLASDASSFINGQTIYVDGGFMARY